METFAVLNETEQDDLSRRYPELVNPWTQPQDEEPIEEQKTEIPCSFTGPLYYLSKPHHEVVRDYFDMFDTHVAPEWLANPRVEQLLRSEKALKVFVPEE